MVQVTNRPSPDTSPTLLKGATNGNHNKPHKTSQSSETTQIQNLDDAITHVHKFIRDKDANMAKQCIQCMDLHLDKFTALYLLIAISKIKPPTNPHNFQPSAPSATEASNSEIEYWAQELIEQLRHNCLLEIDKNADFILKQREIIELCEIDLTNIVTRDTLQVSNELLVYSAIMRWAAQECVRNKIEKETVNLKAVLKHLVYAPRYGLMTKNDFLCRKIDGIKGPDRSGILDENETEKILECIKSKNKSMNLPHKDSQPRRIGQEKPFALSSKSQNRRSSRESTPSTDSKPKPSEKILINCLTCFTAVFD